jgi:hypothetical protein
MPLAIKKRGRPSKADLAARTKATKPRSDTAILADVVERFEYLSILTQGAVEQSVRSLTITGGPGIGKTYNVERILQHAKQAKGTKYEVVRGTLSAINLYMLAYRNRMPGSVVVLDDADTIFQDEDALNILKVLCDSSEERVVSYLKEAPQLREHDIPQTFAFRGAMIFVSNLDFQKYVDEGKNKYAVHFDAIMSRSLYLPIPLHSNQELSVWVSHIAKTQKIFQREGVSPAGGEEILSFIKTHRDNIRKLSIRTLVNLCQLYKTHNTKWKGIAKATLCR